ncbi:MAG: hypothetical protein AAF558_11220 [Verrucomicrobiota bacterium]
MELPSWTDRLENRFGDWAIPYVVRGLVLLNVLTWFLNAGSQGFTDSLYLNPNLVLAGEFWRVITYLFVPTVGQGMFSPLFLLFFFLFTWFIGDALESTWGSFKLTLYLVLGILSMNGFALATGMSGTNIFFLQTFLFCFATLFPNHEIMLFPIPIPIKVKWIGIFFGAYLFLIFLTSPGIRLLILASLVPYVTYMGPGALQILRERQDSKARMKRFKGDD